MGEGTAMRKPDELTCRTVPMSDFFLKRLNHGKVRPLGGVEQKRTATGECTTASLEARENCSNKVQLRTQVPSFLSNSETLVEDGTCDGTNLLPGTIYMCSFGSIRRRKNTAQHGNCNDESVDHAPGGTMRVWGTCDNITEYSGRPADQRYLYHRHTKRWKFGYAFVFARPTNGPRVSVENLETRGTTNSDPEKRMPSFFREASFEKHVRAKEQVGKEMASSRNMGGTTDSLPELANVPSFFFWKHREGYGKAVQMCNTIPESRRIPLGASAHTAVSSNGVSMSHG